MNLRTVIGLPLTFVSYLYNVRAYVDNCCDWLSIMSRIMHDCYIRVDYNACMLT